MVNAIHIQKSKTVNGIRLQFFFLYLLFPFFICLLSSCISVNLQTNFKRGNGNLISSVVPVSPFKAVVSSIPCRYSITRADTAGCRIEVDENLLPFLNITVVNSVLYIESQYAFFTKEEPRIYISTPSLDSVVNTVSSTVHITYFTERMVIRQNGSGVITMKGSSREALFEIANSGEIQAIEFPTSVTFAYSNGYGLIRTTTDSLFAKCTIKGKVEYKKKSVNDVVVRKVLTDKGAVKEIEK